MNTVKKPEEIKKGLVEVIEEASWVVEGGDAHDLIDAVEKAHASTADALALIQQLEEMCEREHLNAVQSIRKAEELKAECLKQVERIAKDINVHRWISVEERLPENTDDVLIITPVGICMGYYDIYHCCWYNYVNVDDERVTYWISLPEPPKEG